MKAKEWLLPLALGAIAAVLVVVLPSPSLPHSDPLPAAVEEPLGIAWAFREAVAPAGTQVSFLAVGEPEQEWLDVRCPEPRRLVLVAESEALWRLDMPAGCATLDGSVRVDVDLEGPRFGADGHNATVVTVYVFNEGGELVASNAGATLRNRYRLYGDFVTLSDTPWYLGDGSVPPGMRVPGGYVDFARGRMAGTPVGGVAWGHVPVHEYDWLTGPLWITARVDILHPAP